MAQNLAAKYRPQTFEDICEQSVIVDIVRKICESKQLSNRNFLFIGPAGTGKAQPLDSKVLTPSGFIEMREVEVGTRVVTGSGDVGVVSGVYPQGERDVYKITLQDRTVIRVADNHLNCVYRYNEDKKIKEHYTLTTLELIDFMKKSRFKLRIDTPVVEFEERDLPVDPYLLGALIGDGSLSQNSQFSNSEQDVVDKVDNILRRDYGYCLRKVAGDNVDWAISPLRNYKYKFLVFGQEVNNTQDVVNTLVDKGYPRYDPETILRIANGNATGVAKDHPELMDSILLIDTNPEWHSNKLMDQLEAMNLRCKSVDKHIPLLYLTSSYDQRLQLLQGLYDTDGYTGKAGDTQFYTSSPQLSEDFAFLVRSLGIRDTVTRGKAHYKTADGEIVECNDVYSHCLHMPHDIEFCTSKKHLARRRNRQNGPIRNIVSIEYIGREECQCIMIDHPDHTYISDGFIPTHNTTTARVVARMLNEGQGEPIEMDAASHSGANDMREVVAQAQSYPIGMNYKVFIIDEVHAISSQGWQVLLKSLEEQPAKTVMILCTTNPEKIPPTILSRVQTFQLSKISLEGIHSRLLHIIEEENKEGRGITYQDDAILYISKMANGGMRDSITLLDKALAYSTDVTIENLQKSLGLPNYDDYFELLNAIAKKNNQQITTIVNQVYNSGVNFVKWFDGFFSFVTNIVKYIYLQDINQTMIPSIYQDKIKGYGTAHAALCLKLSNKLVTLNQELKTSQYLQELAIAHLCTPPTK